MQRALAYNAVQSNESQLIFQVTISPTSSGPENKPSMELHVGFLLLGLFFDHEDGKDGSARSSEM
jgi:hypothetical protein